MPSRAGEWRTYWLYRTGFAIGRHTPRLFAAALAEATGRYCARTMAGRRALVAAHLEKVLGRPLEGQERERAVRAAFSSYAKYWLESTRATGSTPRALETRGSAEGLGYLDHALTAGRGAILALPHMGSWDSGGAWLASAGYPLAVVAEVAEPRRLFDWFVELRRGMGLEVIPLDSHAGTAVGRVLRANRGVALVSDRDIAGNGVEVGFFGEKTRLPAGPATLAIRTGAALLPAGVYLRPGGRVHCVIRPPLPVERTGAGLREDVRVLTEALAREMESLIREAPEQWHLFQPNWPSDPGWKDREPAPGAVGGVLPPLPQ